MRTAQVLPFLYYFLIATSTGFAPDNQRSPRDLRTKNVFQRESNNANNNNNNKLVYCSATLSSAAFIQPMGDADASDVVHEAKRKKGVSASSSSKAVLPSAGKQRQRRVEVLVSKSSQTLSETTKPVQLKSDETKPSRTRKLGKDAFQVQWNTRFEQLVEYKQQYGNCLVPYQFQENPQLGQWVVNQRAYYSSEPKKISADRIQRLNEIGFAWDVHYAQWESLFNQLLEYKQQHGDCLVPIKFQENPQLAEWVVTQRKCYKRATKTISVERIQRLEAIGFVWDVFGVQWELRFKELLEYKREHGDCLVPDHFQENKKLWLWVKRQRKYYNSEPKLISEDRIQRLNTIGFVWDVRDAQWELQFDQLVEYKQQHGDCLVPTEFHKNPQLGNWVTTQRHLYNQVPKMISKDYEQKLDGIGFVWDFHKAYWELRFKELLEYKQRYGNCLVPSEFRENPKLGNWVGTQRKLYKRVPRMLSDEYTQRLNDIGFAWVGRYIEWEEGFEALLEYKQQYGDCLVPQWFRENPPLARWVRHQRKCYKSEPKRITDTRIRRLEYNGFVWDVHDAQWDLRFEELVEYKQQHGDCFVPQRFQESEQHLAYWVRHQRKCYSSEPKTISDERIQRLESIGFVWDINDAKWELRFKQLVEYKQEYDDCLVPLRFQKNPELGRWVCRQRQYYKCKPKMISDERIQQLDAIGFVWDASKS